MDTVLVVKKVAAYLETHPWSSSAQIAKMLGDGKHSDYVNRLLRKWVRENRVEFREGCGDRGGKGYRVRNVIEVALRTDAGVEVKAKGYRRILVPLDTGEGIFPEATEDWGLITMCELRHPLTEAVWMTLPLDPLAVNNEMSLHIHLDSLGNLGNLGKGRTVWQRLLDE